MVSPSRMIKAVAILIVLGYCSLLVYQGGVTFNFQESGPVSVQVSEDPVLLELVTNSNTKNNVKRNNITLDDIFISVKTSKIYQKSRLKVILHTWFQLAKNQTWFFTDSNNEILQRLTNGHMVNTKCLNSHTPRSLCCKTSVEYDFFLESGKRWFCHFDDDNYVNVPRLVTVLQRYNPQKDWYLGRPSIREPIVIKVAQKHMFRFGTFGAGVCISRSLALKMVPVASGGRFISACVKIKFPDDVTMGFVIECLLRTKLTFVPEFHSHLEQLKLLPAKTFHDQISFSYDVPKNSENRNVINISGYDINRDPTRFFSLHCFLFPHMKTCLRFRSNNIKV